MPEFATGGIIEGDHGDDSILATILDNSYIMSAAEAEICRSPGLLKLINDRESPMADAADDRIVSDAHQAIMLAGTDEQTATDVINQLHNAGLLLRRRS